MGGNLAGKLGYYSGRATINKAAKPAAAKFEHRTMPSDPR